MIKRIVGCSLKELSNARYNLEPYILDFANFKCATNQLILEVGIGAGADFEQWCCYSTHATGVDFTDSAVSLTSERLRINSTPSHRYTLVTADAEKLPFAENSFDIVYSWGVLHHTPDTRRAFLEAYRVLKPGGVLKAMIYHHPSWTGLMLYFQYAVARVNFRRSMREIIFEHLESPGTKLYTTSETEALLKGVGFSKIKLLTRLGPGDLLLSKPSKKYRKSIYRALWRFHPRWLVRMLGHRYGLELLITAAKPTS